MPQIDLGGTWTAQQVKGDTQVSAQVPGTIHQDLLAAGVIPDWNWRDDEQQSLWVGEEDWRFHREFSVDAAFLAHDMVQLECDGLDTLATIYLNGKELGKADNQFRS